MGRYWVAGARSRIDSGQVCRVIRGKYVHKSLLSAERGRKCGISGGERRVEHREEEEEEGGKGGGNKKKKRQGSAHASSATFNGELWSQITPRLTTWCTTKRNHVR